MESAKDFTDLIVWKKAHEFTIEVYKTSKNFPKEELYGLTSQFRRAAVSIPVNIAEGFTKKSNLDKIRFYNIAQGSECKYYLILSKELGYYKELKLFDLSNEIGKLLNSYIHAIKTNH
ncbi:hypothetical protein MNBD_IGNAVI01-844 [hydrothermal vent metagenome]|uniref:Four helix bundle protein n=1 Tax=hydrothermal vent metagenome TaxID=652676 RepID=A0A3B1C2G6_9ZZZZ